MNNPKHTSVTMKFLACLYCNKNILLLHWISLKKEKKRKIYAYVSQCVLTAHPH